MNSGMQKFKALIFVAIVVALVYVGYSNVPPWWHYYQFRDDLDDISRHYTYVTRTDDELKQIVITKAKEEDISLKEDQVKVSHGNDGLGIVVQYSIHVDMGVFAKDWDFTAQSQNKRI
jgi:hypothetical protein